MLPLTTDDAFWRCQFLATLSVGTIRCVLAERVGQGEEGGCTTLANSAWRLLQLAIEKPWLMPVGHLSASLHKWA